MLIFLTFKCNFLFRIYTFAFASFLFVNPGINRIGLLPPSYAIILVDAHTMIFEPRYVVMLFNQGGNISNLSIAIAIDQSETLDLIVYSLSGEFS